MEAPPPYPGLNTAPQQYPMYPQMGYPAQGYGMFVPQANGPQAPVYMNGGGAQASAPPYGGAPMAPPAPGFSYNTMPPTYDEATKKTQ